MSLSFWKFWCWFLVLDVCSVGIRAHQILWSMVLVSDLQHWVWKRLEPFLAAFAEVVIWSEWALISYSLDWAHVTSITDKALMDNLLLLLLLLLQMLHHELLIFLCAIFSDLNLQNVVQIFEELGLQLACGITFLAWQAFLVDLWTITSKAIWQVIIQLELLVEISRTKNEAADFFLCTNGVLLACLSFSVDFCAAHHFLEAYLCLWTDLVCSADSVDMLFRSCGGLCVAAEAVLDHFLVIEVFYHVSCIRGCGARGHIINILVISTGDWMWVLHFGASRHLESVLRAKRLILNSIEQFWLWGSFSVSCLSLLKVEALLRWIEVIVI